MTPPAKKGQVDLGAEERRARVQRVRDVADEELSQIENVLLDVQARLPTVLSLVQNARTKITTNTTPVKADAA